MPENDVIDEIIAQCKRLPLSSLDRYTIAKEMLIDAQDDGHYSAKPGSWDAAIKRITKGLGI